MLGGRTPFEEDSLVALRCSIANSLAHSRHSNVSRLKSVRRLPQFGQLCIVLSTSIHGEPIGTMARHLARAHDLKRPTFASTRGPLPLVTIHVVTIAGKRAARTLGAENLFETQRRRARREIRLLFTLSSAISAPLRFYPFF